MNNLAINPAVNFGRRNPQTDNAEGKSNKSRNLKIAAAVVGTAAAVTAGVVYRKNIMDFLTNGLAKIKKVFKKNDEIGDLRKLYSSKTKLENQKHLDFLNSISAEADIARQKELAKMRDEAFDVFSKLDVQA